MRLHRRHRHVELIGDLLVQLACDDQPQHHALLRRQRADAAADALDLRLGIRRGREIVGDIDVTRQDRLDRRDDLAALQRFGDEPGGTVGDRAVDDLAIRRGGHEHDGQRREPVAQHRQPGKAARIGHVEIEQDEVEIALAIDDLDRFGDR